VSRLARVRVPASSANLGPGFDLMALALDLWLEVEARAAAQTRIEWHGEGSAEVPLDEDNLIALAAQEGWESRLPGIDLRVRNAIPIGRGLGSSAASIVAGIQLGARLRGLRLSRNEVLLLARRFEGHDDNLAAALFGGLCIVAPRADHPIVHRLEWPPRWKVVLFVPEALSPTHEARRLVPAQLERGDAIFNMSRVAEWVLAVTRRDRALLAAAMEDRLHQPARSRAYPYLEDVIAAALKAGALGAALSGAGGSVIAVVDGKGQQIGAAMLAAARRHKAPGRILEVTAWPRR
jgi:homoserine kinase